ncbi:MAG: hypothetical protein ACD_50C00082G0003 [uncultured bacterium]|nr:MAG: hypothetical protein ACD_50C00082G0003 [uncultured bacterium]OGH13191.1 MAG: hypothetical protein A2687_00630 [Candidatus Levybacteria bacterium RIFCSPHIGHO2_01_FULL_38_26]
MGRPELLGSSGLESNDREVDKRYTLLPLRKLDLARDSRELYQDLSAYYNLLTNPKNRIHYANPPIDASDLKQRLLHDRTHTYLSENKLGSTVAGGGINDAAENEHDHFLVKVVIDPELQGHGMGRRFIAGLVDKAFHERTDDGRIRTKLDAAIIRDVPEWDRMPRALRSLGFKFVHYLPNQITIVDQESGVEKTQPTERWEILREDWMRMRRRIDIRDILSQLQQ